MRKLAFVSLVLLAAMLIAAPEASTAKKKAKPAPAKRTPSSVTLRDTSERKISRPIPVRPAPDSGFTTIAPYPPPYDTSRDAAQRGRLLNVPKPGATTLVPLPTPGPSPEPLLRVPPTYPPEAREKGIQGTVMVRARVLDDGSVAEAHATTPIPYLDAAAEACVRQWRFKPAAKRVDPVQVWVTIPVKFTLH